jgi:hypothetical protein
MLSKPKAKIVEGQNESKLEPVDGQTNNGFTFARKPG